MIVTLAPHVEALIRQKVEADPYRIADEVIQEALAALEEREHLRRLRAKLQIGIAQLDRGEGVPFTPSGGPSDGAWPPDVPRWARRPTPMSAPKHPVVLSPDAPQDDDDILLYSLLNWGEEQMHRYQDSLDRAVDDVGIFPEMGRRRDDLCTDCHVLHAEHHVLYYRVEATGIQVVRTVIASGSLVTTVAVRPPNGIAANRAFVGARQVSAGVR